MHLIHYFKFFIILFLLCFTITSSGFTVTTSYTINNSSIVNNDTIVLEEARLLRSKFQYKKAIQILESFIASINIDSKINEVGDLYYELAINYKRIQNEVKAIEYGELAKLNYEKTNLITPNQINNLIELSRLYALQSHYEWAKIHLDKAFDYATVSGNTKLLPEIYTNFSQLYDFQKDYVLARKNLLKALDIYNNNGDNDKVIITKLNLLRIFTEEKNITAADSILKQLPNNLSNPNQIYYLNVFKSKIFLEKKEYDKAIFFNEIALETSKNVAMTLEGLTAEHNRANIYMAMGQHNEAIKNFKEHLHHVISLKRSICIKEVYESLSKIYEKNGDDKRLNETLKNYIKIKDSLYNIEKRNRTKFSSSLINMERTRYKLKENNQKIELLNKSKKIKEIYNILLLITIILLFILSFILIKRQKKLRVIEEEVSKKERLNLEQQIKFRNTQILDFSIRLENKNVLLNKIKKQIQSIQNENTDTKNTIHRINSSITSDIKKNKQEIELYAKMRETNTDFLQKINYDYKDLSYREEQIIQLLRLNFSSKEIASQLNLSVVSIDTYRSKIRRKMNIPKGKRLSDFIKEL